MKEFLKRLLGPPFLSDTQSIDPAHIACRLIEVRENSWMQSYLIMGLSGPAHFLP